MKKFIIYTNPIKDKDNKISNKISEYLKSRGAECISVKMYLEQFEKSADVSTEDMIMIVLGGDGTMLRAIRECINFDGAVIGINLGTLGFLTEIELSNVEEGLDRLIADDYKIEKRMLLEASTAKSNELWALNDVVLSRCAGLRIMTFDIYVNGQLLLNYKADGIIISTPTGSTGYNLSAGGPIASPASELIVLTPICPHSLNQRSIILSGTDVVSIKIPQSRDDEIQEMEINFDNNIKESVKTGDVISIKKADRHVKFAKLSKDSFLEVLNKKMSDV